MADLQQTNSEKILLSWVRQSCKNYKDINVVNFSTSWADGLTFNALIHSHRFVRLKKQTSIYSLLLVEFMLVDNGLVYLVDQRSHVLQQQQMQVVLTKKASRINHVMKQLRCLVISCFSLCNLKMKVFLYSFLTNCVVGDSLGLKRFQKLIIVYCFSLFPQFINLMNQMFQSAFSDFMQVLEILAKSVFIFL